MKRGGRPEASRPSQPHLSGSTVKPPGGDVKELARAAGSTRLSPRNVETSTSQNVHRLSDAGWSRSGGEIGAIARSTQARACATWIDVLTGETVLSVAPLRSRLVKSVHRRDGCATALVSTQARRLCPSLPDGRGSWRAFTGETAVPPGLMSTQAGRLCPSLPDGRGS